MSKKWDKIANEEFESLDQAEQNDWADLRRKVSRRK
jgi:hypothetical protein